jgi:hypothetical protein
MTKILKKMSRALWLVVALSLMAPQVLAQTYENKNLAPKQVWNKVLAEDGSGNPGAAFFSMLALPVTYPSGNLSVKSIVNKILVKDGSGNYGFAVACIDGCGGGPGGVLPAPTVDYSILMGDLAGSEWDENTKILANPGGYLEFPTESGQRLIFGATPKSMWIDYTLGKATNANVDFVHEQDVFSSAGAYRFYDNTSTLLFQIRGEGSLDGGTGSSTFAYLGNINISGDLDADSVSIDGDREFLWNGRSKIVSGADGDAGVTNAAGTDFGTLTLGAAGGTSVTISSPATATSASMVFESATTLSLGVQRAFLFRAKEDFTLGQDRIVEYQDNNGVTVAYLAGDGIFTCNGGFDGWSFADSVASGFTFTNSAVTYSSTSGMTITSNATAGNTAITWDTLNDYSGAQIIYQWRDQTTPVQTIYGAASPAQVVVHGDLEVEQSVTSDEGFWIEGPDSDTSPAATVITGKGAWPQATSNPNGGAYIVAPGMGVRYFEIINRANTTGDIYDIWVDNGAKVTLTEGVDFTCAAAASDQDCLDNMETALETNVEGVDGVGTLPRLLVTRSGPDSRFALKLATSDATGIDVTEGTDGGIRWSLAEAQFVATGTDTFAYKDRAGNSVITIKPGADVTDPYWQVAPSYPDGADGAVLRLAPTWTTGAVTYTVQEIDVTDTASASGSAFEVYTIDGVEVWRVEPGTLVGADEGDFKFAMQAKTVSPPLATTHAGLELELSASDAVAGTSTPGAAAGGDVTVYAGDAKRLTSGDAGGGNITLTTGTEIGSGTPGDFQVYIGNDANPLLLLDGSNGLDVGDTTNYARVATDGTISLAGTARVTKCVDLNNEDLSVGATAPDQTILGNYLGWSYDIADDSVFTAELPRDWDPGTDVVIYVRWYIDEAYATNSGEVRWQIAWSAVPDDETEAVDSPTHSGTADSGDIDIPATAKYFTSTTVVTISGASLSEGDEIGMTLSRIALVGGSDPTADPVIVQAHLVYTSDRLGE